MAAEKMESKNDIFLWILEQDRQKDQERLVKEINRKAQINTIEKENHCFKCKKTFDKPKLIQYHACPHCLNKIEEKEKKGCQYWFGFLSQKDKSESVPSGCVECEKVMECMLNQYYDSASAVSEIKKWY